MPAYIVVDITVHDPIAYEPYKRMAHEISVRSIIHIFAPVI